MDKNERKKRTKGRKKRKGGKEKRGLIGLIGEEFQEEFQA